MSTTGEAALVRRWTSSAVFLALLLAFTAMPVAADAAPRIVEVGAAGSDAGPKAGASSLRVPDNAGEGLRTNGRIFGFDPHEGPYSCSGTALNTPSQSIV